MHRDGCLQAQSTWLRGWDDASRMQLPAWKNLADCIHAAPAKTSTAPPPDRGPIDPKTTRSRGVWVFVVPGAHPLQSHQITHLTTIWERWVLWERVYGRAPHSRAAMLAAF